MRTQAHQLERFETAGTDGTKKPNKARNIPPNKNPNLTGTKAKTKINLSLAPAPRLIPVTPPCSLRRAAVWFSPLLPPPNESCSLPRLNPVPLYKVCLEIVHSGEPLVRVLAAPYWTGRPLGWAMHFRSVEMSLEIPGTFERCITLCTRG